MLLGPRRDDGEGAFEAREDLRAGLANLQRERRVNDVRGGEAVVEPAALVAELLGDGIDEGGGVVVKRRLELGDPLWRRWGRLGDARRGVLGHDSELGPGCCRRELDREPGCELPLVRPDPGHGRAGVAGDHGPSLEASPAGAISLERGTATREIRRYSAADFFPRNL
jgi:hypothetical protein